MTSIVLTAAVALAWPDKLLAQKDNLKFERISLEQGLSQNTIYCILQDRKGFMWFGTQDGLNKFDGYDFKVYKHDPQDPNSLSNNVVRTIYEDRAGTLWIGTNGGGLNKLDGEKDSFTHYRHDPNDANSLSDNYVLSICEVSRHGRRTLWIGTRYGGLNQFEMETGRFTRYQNDPNDAGSLSDNYVISIYEDSLHGGSTLWIGTYGGGLNKLILEESNRERGVFNRYQYDSTASDDLGHKQIRVIYEDRAGTLWLGTGGGLDKLDRRDGTVTHYHHDSNDPASLSASAVWSIFESRQGRDGLLWIGTGNGLNQFDRAAEKFYRYHHDPNDPNSLSDNYIRSICEDRSGMLWIGTWNGGINKLDRRRGMFTHYRNIPNDPNSLSHNNVRAIYEDARDGGNTLWIGTRGGGLNKFDRQKQAFTHYKDYPNDPNGLSHNYVWSIYEDRAGNFWISTYGDGLKRFERKKERFTHYRHDPADPNSLSRNSVTPIYEDRSGMLWIGTDVGGLNIFDREKETFKHYKHDANDSTSLSHDNIWSIFEDRSGVLWIGTDGGGLNRFDREKEVFKHYKNEPDNPQSVSNNHVFCIHEDSRSAGTLWLGTWGGGLNKFDTATEKFVHYTEKDGLPNDVIYGILEDDHGNLWLSTNKGISRFNIQTETFKNYNTHDGLQSYEFNAGAYHKSKSGEMFFGGINGFNAFYPDEVKDNAYIPPIVITAFKKFDQIAKRDIAATDEIALSYKDKYLTFEFVALDYTNPEKNQYAYIMEGFDETWIDAGTRRFVSYTNLDPGNYVFKVKGSNNDGVWNEDGVAVKITITPPPWKTWWAFTLYV
ncbi:histidine kinase, partial [candidate division KSB1 bacterium]|nr:histidine kinase [candidate division KSB1 bacterium]